MTVGKASSTTDQDHVVASSHPQPLSYAWELDMSRQLLCSVLYLFLFTFSLLQARTGPMAIAMLTELLIWTTSQTGREN
jgi:hypothetical protein